MLVGKRVTADPKAVGAEDLLTRAADLMRKFRINHLPVVEEGKLVGILSDTDLRNASLTSVHLSGLGELPGPEWEGRGGSPGRGGPAPYPREVRGAAENGPGSRRGYAQLSHQPGNEAGGPDGGPPPARHDQRADGPGSAPGEEVRGPGPRLRFSLEGHLALPPTSRRSP